MKRKQPNYVFVAVFFMFTLVASSLVLINTASAQLQDQQMMMMQLQEQQKLQQQEQTQAQMQITQPQQMQQQGQQQLTPQQTPLGNTPQSEGISSLTIISAVDGNNQPLANEGTTYSDKIMAYLKAEEGKSAPATFLCSLDGTQASPCSNPVILENLKPGKHVLQIAGIDTLGNVGTAPASFRWTIVGPGQQGIAELNSDNDAHDHGKHDTQQQIQQGNPLLTVEQRQQVNNHYYQSYGNPTSSAPSPTPYLSANSIASSQTFGNIVNLSNDKYASCGPSIAASGNNVYVSWNDDYIHNDVPNFYRRSIDGGNGFESAVALGDYGRVVAASGNDVYVQSGDNILKSNDGGKTFGQAIPLNSNGVYPQSFAASGNNVYLAGTVITPADPYYLYNVVYRISTDGGKTFGDAIPLSNDGNSQRPNIAASGNDVHVIWYSNGIYVYKKSTDGGKTFSNMPPVFSWADSIAASGNNRSLA